MHSVQISIDHVYCQRVSLESAKDSVCPIQLSAPISFSSSFPVLFVQPPGYPGPPERASNANAISNELLRDDHLIHLAKENQGIE